MTGRQDVFQQAMNQGHSAAWDQMWERAAAYYRQALAEFPENSQALSSLGMVLIELQEYDEAMRCYQRSARANPEDPLPLEKIAQLGERLGQLDLAVQVSLRGAELYLKNRDAVKAIESWERVTRLNPDNLTAHSRLALVHERMTENEKAAVEYLAMASLLQANGEPEKAMQTALQAVKLAPNNDDAHRAVAALKDFRQLPRPARPKGGTAPLRMSQVRQLEAPQTPDQVEMDPIAQARQKALTIMAGMLFEGSDEERENRRGLQAIVTGATGSTGMLQRPIDRTRMVLHLSQVVDLQTRGDYNEAIDELQKAIEAGLENAGAYFDLGLLFSQAGRVESAIRHLQSSVKHHDFALASRLLLGDLLRKRSQLKEASFEYLEALKLADAQVVPPEQSNDLLQLYDLLIESNRQESSPELQIRLCDNIQDMLVRPDWREQIRKARLQLPGQGSKGPPIPLAEILLEARSGQVIQSVSSIYEMIDQGHYRTAMEEALRAILDAPTYLPLHAIIGDMLVKQGEMPAATAKYQVIARVYAMRGDIQQAITYARRVVELSPTDLSARGKLIDQLIQFGRIEEALQEYMQLAGLYYSLADLSMARKTYTEALRVGQQANIDRGLRVKIMHRMADIDNQSLDWRQAMRVLEQIRTLQPDDAEARLRLIQMNFRLGQEPQALAELDNYIAFLNSHNQSAQLISLAENLESEYPDRIPVRRRLVELYQQLGRKDAAVHQLDQIGDILIEAGDRAGAIQTVEMILALDPPNKSDYQQVLTQLKSS